MGDSGNFTASDITANEELLTAQAYPLSEATNKACGAKQCVTSGAAQV